MGARKNITLRELAEMVGGRVEGNGETVLSGVCSLENPKEGHIGFVVGSAKLSKEKQKPAALIVTCAPEGINLPLLIHPDPRVAFTRALKVFYGEEKREGGVDPRAVVDGSAKVDPTAWVGPFAVVEGEAEIRAGAEIWPGCYVGRRSVIGAETKLLPNVVVMHDVEIGARCIIHPGAVIGSDGFGFTRTEKGNEKVLQVGKVIIGDDVEIGANSTIDRATLDATVIGNDVKIDNLVQIAHNVRIGEHTRIAAQTGVSGRVEIGAEVVIGGQAGFQNGVKIGDRSIVGGQAGVIGDVPEGSKVSGYPARDHRKAMRILALQNRLPEVMERLENLEREIFGRMEKR